MSLFGKLLLFLTGASAVAQQIAVTNTEEHNAAFKRGAALISPNMELLDRAGKSDAKARAEITEGIRYLNAVTEYNPENWAAFWIKGKGYQSLGDWTAANAEFKKSFEQQDQNPDVAREYALSCMELGLSDEAIKAAVHAVKTDPADSGLQANLALAYLIGGKIEEAKKAIAISLEKSPDDKISQTVKTVIEKVASGEKKQPKKMADLQ